MGDYTEHLISMAGGDGDELEEFRSDMKSIRSTLRLAKEHLALLALVREQAAQIERVNALADSFDEKASQASYFGSEDQMETWLSAANCLRAALTATDKP